MTLSRRTAMAAAAVGGLTLAADFAAAQERHPKIRAAIKALQEAKEEMQHAAHDYGGHREAALKACDNALEQLRLAVQYQEKK